MPISAPCMKRANLTLTTRTETLQWALLGALFYSVLYSPYKVGQISLIFLRGSVICWGYVASKGLRETFKPAHPSTQSVLFPLCLEEKVITLRCRVLGSHCKGMLSETTAMRYRNCQIGFSTPLCQIICICDRTLKH